MGIYPHETFKWLPNGILERTYNDFSGVEVTTYFQPILEIEVRTDCFCCSCESEGSDPACRNHGWAAKRPCEVHGTEGVPWDDEPEHMPESVQQYRKTWTQS